MKTIKFRIKLLADVIVNVKAATEGNQNTLDFIPGSNFLGIVAAGYDKYSTAEQLDLFHNGTVRYGDAHPVNEGSIVRSSHVPASMFFQKLKTIEEGCYIHHAYDRASGQLQLKQSRNGFYEFNDNEGVAVSTPKSFAIKSAYDRNERRARDSQMYGYESLCAGTEFLFEVETDNDAYEQVIVESLVGKRHIGRSRTAQYGLVEITREDHFSQPESTDRWFMKDGKSYALVYADSRLIFLDDNGEQTFQPTASALGLEGNIRYDLSQIRTFQYAPWNFKRHTRDADRCGIEKGSVFVVELASGFKPETPVSRYVGNYNNEGFGRVIYNPSFLEDNNGLSLIKFRKDEKKPKPPKEYKHEDSSLLKYLSSRKKHAEALNVIYEEVNGFVDANSGLFVGNNAARFASQWGAIRSIATTSSGYDDLKKKLISNEIDVKRVPSPDNPKEYKKINKAYLGHGVAADKWKGKRKNTLESFINDIFNNYNAIFGDITVEAVVNLASQMAKTCKKQ